MKSILALFGKFGRWWISKFQNARAGGKVLWGCGTLVTLCIGLSSCLVFTDSSLRSVGILPTLTPTLTPSATPTPSNTPAPTETPLPTNTAVPTNTPTPTDVPPTETPTLIPTETPTTTPTNTAVVPPTNTPIVGPFVVISRVNKEAEYVDLANIGSEPQDLAGWMLRSEKGPQDCRLSGVIEPGQTLRVYARSADSGLGGFNCGFGDNIWNNDENDPAVLFNAAMMEVSRR